ncbi:MAG: VacB/RNase II family 3'-5' exoribonuclease [Phycisphaeraceae bacterium]
MAEPFEHRLLSHLKDRRYRPTRMEELAEDLGIQADELEEFGRSVQKLIDDGQLVIGRSETVVLPPMGGELIGSFRKAERGYGFIVPDSPVGHGDLFVPAPYTAGAMTGDHVRAKVVHEPRRGKDTGKSPYVGHIVEIIQRADRKYVGNLRKLGSQWVVEVDGKALRDPVIVRDPHAKNAKSGDKVVVELIEYPKEDKPAQGVITEVLGEQGEPDVETLAVMRAHGLREGFPSEVVENARAAVLGFDDAAVPADREDLTGQFILTIDPPDAKDYDDAISIRRLEREGDAVYELGVHIADVAYFVRPGSPLDTEGYTRGNSTYLPRRVVPMLPEVLSNGVCSLQEGVNRFTLSAFMRYDAQGNVQDQRISRSVIRSAKRLTYIEAQLLIDDNLREAIKHTKSEPKYPRQTIPTLKLMDELAKLIRTRRLKQGMVVLGLPKVELVFDDSGRVIDAMPEDDSFTHTIIEMFMVEANEAAARLFDGLSIPMIRRIHPDPPSFDIDELRSFCRVAGFNIPEKPSRQELQQLLDSVRGKPAQHAVHLAVLQTLSRAVYSPELVGHYALASEHYTHFTSPIRRYPDLVVHRGLAAFLDAKADSGNRRKLAQAMRDDPRVPSEEKLFEIGKHTSTTERNSAAAEGNLRTYLVLDLLRQHLGDDYDGTVTGVSNDGAYVQIDRYLIDGFVRTSDLPGQPGDVWRLNRTTGALVAQRSGKTMQIGDRYTVRIAKVNPERRHMELVIVSRVGVEPQPRQRKQSAGARKAHQETLRLKQQRRAERRKRR